MKKIVILGLAAALLSSAALPAVAFERVGDRKVIVFGGRQQVPVIDPHVRYDWSIRMMQQSLYDAMAKYTGNPAKIDLGWRRNGNRARMPRPGPSIW